MALGCGLFDSALCADFFLIKGIGFIGVAFALAVAAGLAIFTANGIEDGIFVIRCAVRGGVRNIYLTAESRRRGIIRGRI